MTTAPKAEGYPGMWEEPRLPQAALADGRSHPKGKVISPVPWLRRVTGWAWSDQDPVGLANQDPCSGSGIL